jgi:suppressor for copper-sensitivity B
LALLGGFILNLMPCVLPVLSIKLLGLVEHAGRPRGAVRATSLATASGVVASFLALAALLIGLKAAGIAVGWGLQFQQPAFLAAMIVLLTLFACNLWGFFEIGLPGWAGSLGAGTADRRDDNLAGNFAAGAFATLLATPCSAPFLGTAVGFALASGPLEILAVFAALGVGLALPYLLVAAVPATARLLPRPGRWMLTLRRALGLLLVGTALWLLWVLRAQAGDGAAMLVAVLVGAGGLLLRFARRPLLRRAAVAASLLAAVPAAALFAGGAAPKGVSVEGWASFDRDAIDRLVAEGKTVFVDVTADWCLTCQVNKKLVLQTEAVRALLTRPDVVAMRADWTRPDERIAAYLRSFGRYGIPFNAVYGPGAPTGVALSELLTADEVVGALKRAAGPAKPGERAIVGVPAAGPDAPGAAALQRGG